MIGKAIVFSLCKGFYHRLKADGNLRKSAKLIIERVG